MAITMFWAAFLSALFMIPLCSTIDHQKLLAWKFQVLAPLMSEHCQWASNSKTLLPSAEDHWDSLCSTVNLMGVKINEILDIIGTASSAAASTSAGAGTSLHPQSVKELLSALTCIWGYLNGGLQSLIPMLEASADPHIANRSKGDFAKANQMYKQSKNVLKSSLIYLKQNRKYLKVVKNVAYSCALRLPHVLYAMWNSLDEESGMEKVEKMLRWTMAHFSFQLWAFAALELPGLKELAENSENTFPLTDID